MNGTIERKIVSPMQAEGFRTEALLRIAAALEIIADKYTNPAKFDGKWMTKAEAEAFRRSVGDQT